MRADYGIYYNPMNIQPQSGERNNFRQPTAIIPNPTYPNPYGGRDPVSFVSTAPQNIATMANDLENLQSTAYTAGFSQGLTSALAIHVDGVFNQMEKIPMAVDINPRSGGTVGTRPLTQFARILQTQSVGEMDYKALLVRLEKRFDQSYMYMVSYTLASTEGTVNNIGPASTVTDSAHLDYDNGPNNSDRRNALVASASFVLPGDVTLSGVFTARSTMPFSAIAGVDLNGDGGITDYVPGTTRNVFNRGDNDAIMAKVNAYRATIGMAPLSASQISTNEVYYLDMRANKSFTIAGGRKVEFIVQGFNLFNRTNLLAGWQTSARSPKFGVVESAGPMRQAEVAVRLTF